MTGLIVLGFVPLLAAVMFWLRAARERDARLETERRMQALAERGAEDEEARLRFLAIVAHEIRSPLSAVIGYQELLADGIYGDLDDQAAEALQRIGHAARQLLTLTDGMEELSGRQAANVSESMGVDVVPALREAVDDARRHAASRNVALDVSLPQALAAVRGDPDRTRTALELVLQAAVKLARAAAVDVQVEERDTAIRFSISGTGLEQTRLPDPGTAAGSVASHITSGPALRLAIARRILERMNGGLSVNATPWILTLRNSDERDVTAGAGPRQD